ncbi:hypothetical protein [uncultured Azohydromonas sp.]|jgi:hypothetical protein|uniref:hypothetical protein n=1 Tax=uncultured Azohydromonas sp. TaxID=487342 RepID=UPI00260E4B8B|nr:hypothetical protein [uncultured Azohydromonas sp.]
MNNDEQLATAQAVQHLELKVQGLTQRLATLELAISGVSAYVQTLSPRARQDMASVFDGGLFLGGGVLNTAIKAEARKLLNLP